MLAGLLKTRASSKRHYVIVMAFAIVLIAVGGCIYIFVQKNEVWEYSVPVELEFATSQFTRSQPIRLEIPALTIDTTFVLPLGLMPDQTVSVPDSYEQVGWYSGGVSPGEVGPSVILGHVDSVDGPAVFYSLGELKTGDEIRVTREDGTRVIFTVTSVKRYPQSNFPTLEVYGPTNAPTLRLVTCSGLFDKSTRRYSHNLVIFAELKQ